MMKPTATIEQFYLHIGALLYAVANVDGHVRSEEEDVFRNEVTAIWKDLPLAEPAFHLTPHIGLTLGFYDALKTRDKSENVLIRFEAFKAEHPSLFTRTIRDFIRKSAVLITHAFGQNNKSELVLLSRLEIILSQEKKSQS